jgi:lipopolysaccharide export system permease protein
MAVPAGSLKNALPPTLPGGYLRLVDRMVLGELRGPVFSGIAMFALLTICTVVLQEALKFQIKYGLPNSTMFTMLALAAPQLIVLAIPMGVLLGTMLAMGRLNNDHEIVALRACGQNLYRVLIPVLVLGLSLSLITYLGNEWLVPKSLSALTAMKNDVITGAGGGIQRQRVVIPIYAKEELRYTLIADEISGNEMSGVKLLYFDPNDELKDFYLTARRATWLGSQWGFDDARMVKLQENEPELPAATSAGAANGAEPSLQDLGAQDNSERVIFRAGQLSVPDFSITPKSLGLKAKVTDEMTSRELYDTIQAAVDQEGATSNLPVMRELLTKLYFKYSIPLTPLLFTLVAFPLAIRHQRTSTGMGFGMALLIVLLYYAAYSTCLRMGTAGVMPPWMAAWLPNLALLVAGFMLLERRQRS